MTLSRRTAVRTLSASLMAPCLTLGSLGWITDAVGAEVWPSKPVKLVVPYPAGGTVDAVARLLADHLGGALKQSVVVENRAGAGGVMGADAVAKATDGHTFLCSAVSTLTLSPFLMQTPYNATSDFAPVAQIMYSPVLIVATPAFSGKSFADVLTSAKAKPGSVRLATSGMGTLGHIVLEQIKIGTGVDITHIPYKGGGQIFTDAIGGVFELLVANPSPTLNGFIAQGKFRVLAVTGPKRLPAYLNVPTMTELGLPLANLTSTFGLMASSKTPDAIVQRMNLELTKVLLKPEVQSKLTSLDNVVSTSTAEEFKALIQKEAATNEKLIKEAKISIN